MKENGRFIRIIKDYVSHFKLDLKGAKVLTEAASGYYACTSLLAAAAGADVYAVTGDLDYGKASQNIKYIYSLAEKLRVESKLHFISYPTDTDLALIDIVTNLGFVRPISAEIISGLLPGATISLMCEAWELRPGDVDIFSCFQKNIAVFGTNEDHKDIDVFNFIGPLLVKMLFELHIEIFKTYILVVGEDKFSERIYWFLKSCGAFVERASNRLWLNSISYDLDAIVFADYTFDKKYIGEDGMITASLFAERCPSTSVCVLCGKVDIEALLPKNISCVPPKNTSSYRMVNPFDFLGPLPVVILHSAGLKVAEISWRTWDITKSRQENERIVSETSNAMADTVDWSHYIPAR